MKKKLLVSLVAVGLIAAGGTGFALANAKEKAQDPVYFMQQQRMGQMTKMMNTTNVDKSQQLNQKPNISFEDMLPYMKKMHPDLNDEQLKALFEQMHGANGPCGNGQGGGMMENTNTNL